MGMYTCDCCLAYKPGHRASCELAYPKSECEKLMMAEYVSGVRMPAEMWERAAQQDKPVPL